MADNTINMPSGMGGLTRFSDEYETKISLSPVHVIVFVLIIIGFRIALPLFLG